MGTELPLTGDQEGAWRKNQRPAPELYIWPPLAWCRRIAVGHVSVTVPAISRIATQEAQQLAMTARGYKTITTGLIGFAYLLP